jgi:FkbM family methyltransferase
MKSTPYGFLIKGNAAMQSGEFEPLETAIVRRLLPRVRGFVDIGANVGFFSCLARQSGVRVLAVEPLAENFEALLDNVTANGWTDIEVYPVALGAAAGLSVLYGAGTGASLVKRWSGTSEVWQRRVPLSTLDRLLAGFLPGEPLLIKIDVEGFERAVLDGADATLRRRPAPVWLVEVCLTEHHPGGVNPGFDAVFHAFWDAGYVCRTADEGEQPVTRQDVARWVLARQRDFGGINFVFEHPGGRT